MGCGALRQPLGGLLGVDVDLDGLAARVVVTERVERAAVTGGAAVGDDEAVAGLLGRTDSGEADSDCQGTLETSCGAWRWASAGGGAGVEIAGHHVRCPANGTASLDLLGRR